MLNRPRLILGILILLSFTLAALSFTFKPRRQENVETLRLMTGPPSVYYLPQYIALELGFFRAEKLDLQVENAASEDALLPALESGRCDVVLTGLEQAIYARAIDSKKTVAFAALTAADGTQLLARKTAGTFKWADLKDKTVIAGWPDSRETVLLESILRQHGIAPNREVTLYTNIPARLRAGAFLSGSGDFILAAEPLAAQLESRQTGKVVASLGQAAGPLPAMVYTAREETVKNRPQALQRFDRALYRAQLWLAQHSAGEAATMAAPYLKGMDHDLLIKVIERYRAQGVFALDPVIRREHYQHYMDLIDQAREVPRTLDYRTMIDSRPATAAVQEVQAQIERGKRPWYDPLLKIFAW